MSLPRYPEYKDSGVEWLGKVPGHWEVRRFKQVFKERDERSGCGTETLLSVSAYTGVSPRSEIVDAGDHLSRAESLEGYKICHPDDLVMNIMLAWNRGLAFSSYNGIVSPAYCVFHVIDGSAPIFLNYLVRTDLYTLYFKAFSSGVIDSRLRLYPDVFGSLSCTLPLLAEQHTIAAFLDRETGKIDALIAEQQRLVELLAEKRQAVISHAVTKGLNPNAPMKDSGIEWLGEVPRHWGVGTLTRVAKRIVVGIAEAATHAYAEAGTPILRATNVRAGKIIGEMLYLDSDFADDRGSKLLNAGDLVTVRTGNAGVTAIVPKELDGCQCFTMLITTLIGSSVADFYCYWMNSVAARRYFSLEGWGTAQINISVPILKCLPIPIPTFEEQQAIVAFLDNETTKFDTLTAEANRAIALLQERRSALISAAVTGKIDVRGLALS